MEHIQSIDIGGCLAQGPKGYRKVAVHILNLARSAEARSAEAPHEYESVYDDRIQGVLEALLNHPTPGLLECVLEFVDQESVVEVDEAASARIYGHVESLTELQYDEQGGYLAFGLNILVAHREPTEQPWDSLGLRIDSCEMVKLLKEHELVCDLATVQLYPILLEANVAGCLTYSELAHVAQKLRAGDLASVTQTLQDKAKTLSVQCGPLPKGSSQVMCLLGVTSDEPGGSFPLTTALYAEQWRDGLPFTQEDYAMRLNRAAQALTAVLPVGTAVLNDAPFGWWADDHAGSKYIRDLLATQGLMQISQQTGLALEELLANEDLRAMEGPTVTGALRLHRRTDLRFVAELPYAVLPFEGTAEYHQAFLTLMRTLSISTFRQESELESFEEPSEQRYRPVGSSLH